MELYNLKYNYKSRGHKVKTYGRGRSSGIGGPSTRGYKGQNARKSGGTRLGFEGGQTPIFRRLPKVGFNNPSEKRYDVVTLASLNKVDATTIDLKTLKELKLVSKSATMFKVIGNDKPNRALDVTCNKISKQAKASIEAAGGKVTILPVVNKHKKHSVKKHQPKAPQK